MNWTGPEVGEAKPFGLQRSDLRGAQKTVAGVLMTPVARRLVVWWPGGGVVYARPIAIEYLDGGRTRQIRIVPLRSLALGVGAALGLAAVATSFGLRFQNRRRDSGR